jgi:nitrite reductase/ring-hydroxylating ferredoxin subunit/uncharacterized membrane protein
MAVPQRIVRRIEDFDGLDSLGRPLAALARRATRSTVVRNALSGTWLGHPLHPMLTDVPIGAWVMAGFLDVLGGSSGQLAARRLVGLGVLAAIPTAAAGSSDWAETDDADQRLGLVHGLGNLTVVALQAGSYLARRRGRRGAGMCLSASGLGVMTGTAYLGGHLSFNRGVGVNHTAFEKLVTQWTDVASVAGLAPDTPLRVAADGVPVVLVRREEKIYALSATCVHAGGPLDEGQLLDGCVRCPWHGSTFRLSDGTVVRGPAATDEPSWQVRVEGDRIQVRSDIQPG